jgi:type I protein arginine methyltransferase
VPVIAGVFLSILQSIKPSAEFHPGFGFLDVGRRPRRDFPVWHFAMVNDIPRNQVIERSIAAMDLKGKTVVEIGSGTGLIALLFAKYGASHVFTCEMNPNLAAVARRIVAATPYNSRITIIGESSSVALAQGSLPRHPDVIFTETLDCGVVGEGFLPIANDIADLAGPNTIIMPRTVRQFARLIESESLANLNRASNACGFDLSALNEYSTGNYFPVHTELHRHRFLSDTAVVRDYTYLDCPKAQVHRLKAGASGTISGVLSWFAADFGGAIVSNEPGSGSHWHQAFHTLPEDIHVEAGAEVSLLIDDGGFAWVAK